MRQTGIVAIALLSAAILIGLARAQTPVPVVCGNLPCSIVISTPTATPPPPTPSPSPTPVPICIQITSPVNSATVSGTVSLPTTDTCPGAWFERLFVDGVAAGDFAVGGVQWNTIGSTAGAHTITITAQTKNPNSIPLGAASVVLNVTAAPSPTPSPSGTPSVTPTPSPVSTIIPDPQFPANQTANNTVPTAAFWAEYMSMTNGRTTNSAGQYYELPGSYLQTIDQTPYTDTTSGIFNHYATEYGIPPDVARAEGWADSQWKQGAIGDCSGVSGCTSDGGSGISLGIDQIKSRDYPYTCPSTASQQTFASITAADCASHLSTAFDVEYWALKIHGCEIGQMANYMAQNGRDHGTPGSTDYKSEVAAAAGGNAAAQQQLLFDCVGQHAGGDWRSSTNNSYATQVMSYANSKPWTNAALNMRPEPFMRALKESLHRR